MDAPNAPSPLTPHPGPCNHTPAESNLLSVPHGPSGHPKSMKRQGLMARDPSATRPFHRPIFRAVAHGPLAHPHSMKNRYTEVGLAGRRSSYCGPFEAADAV